MKLRLSEISPGNCFIHRNAVKKKTQDGRIVTVDRRGRVRNRKIKGDPEVRPTPCGLREFGVGLRRNPEEVVEIGDGNLLKGRRRRP